MNTIAKIPLVTSRLFCPVSTSMVNEKMARINGAFTVLMLIVIFFTQSIIPVIVLVVDFSLRAFSLPKYSPFSYVSAYLAKLFNSSPRMINAGPKIFASRIGLMFSVMIAITMVIGFENTVIALSAILGTFSFLEAAFGICVACEIYPRIFRFIN